MLSKLKRRRQDPANECHLGAFGKHPAWDDHIPDLGLSTERLARAKQELYVEGIGGNIDSGAWEDQTLPEFNHFFGWYFRGSWVFGRIWSSVDGKGRSRYPMVVCAEPPPIALPRIVPLVFQRLQRVEEECRTARTTQDVAAVLAHHGDQLRSDSAPHGADERATSAAPVTPIAQCDEMGEDRAGLIRLIYHIDRDLPGCRRRGGGSDRTTGFRTRSAALPSSAMRAPRCADSAADAFIAWAAFLQDVLADGVPMWVICPINAHWVDLLVGAVTASQFVCLRAPLTELPFTTEVPYSVEVEFAEQTRAFLAEASGRLQKPA